MIITVILFTKHEQIYYIFLVFDPSRSRIYPEYIKAAIHVYHGAGALSRMWASIWAAGVDTVCELVLIKFA